jgi:hypothetical protein
MIILLCIIGLLSIIVIALITYLLYIRHKSKPLPLSTLSTNPSERDFANMPVTKIRMSHFQPLVSNPPVREIPEEKEEEEEKDDKEDEMPQFEISEQKRTRQTSELFLQAKQPFIPIYFPMNEAVEGVHEESAPLEDVRNETSGIQDDHNNVETLFRGSWRLTGGSIGAAK